tara:strand:+ start:207 stop:620 length:414 start_codon:yes stop_codon:yes gene_type:complete
VPWREVNIGNAPLKSGIYRFSSRSNARGDNRRYVVRYVGQAKKTRNYGGLRRRLISTHEHYRSGDKVEVFVINDPDTRYRRVEPEDRRTSMTKLDFKERMELHLQMSSNPRACGRNRDLKRWRRNWIRAGSIPIRRW